MENKTIVVLPGDGIGPEVIAEAIKVIDAVAERFGHSFSYIYGDIGAVAIAEQGVPIPENTLKNCLKYGTVLLGAVGDPSFDNRPDLKIRPEQGLLQLRKAMGLHTNIRPVAVHPALMEFSPLKPAKLENVNMVIFRELTQGIYFGEKGRTQNGRAAFDTCTYTAENIRTIAHLAFNAAMERKKKLTLVDKANVLETSRLWREEIQQIAKSFPEVLVEYCYVDNAAMKLILTPADFDVVLTENMFGDILTDEAAVLSGSLGLLPSASIGSKGMLFEPIHGSYPQAKGKGIANPIGAILSAAMMLEMAFEMEIEAAVIRKSVSDAIKERVLTPELCKGKSFSTSAVGSHIAATITSEVFECL